MRWLRLWILLALAGAILFPGVFGTLAFTDITTERGATIETTDKDGSDGTGVIEIESEDEIATGQTDAELVTITNTVSDNQDATVDLTENVDWELTDGSTMSTQTLSTGDSETYEVNTEDVSASTGEYLMLSQSGSFLFEQERTVAFEDSGTGVTFEISGETNELTMSIEEENTGVVIDSDGNDVTSDATITSSEESVVSTDGDTVIAEDEGEATITAEYEGTEDTVDITVIDLDITLEIGGETGSLFMELGDDETATVTTDENEDVTGDAEITSDDESIVSITDTTVSGDDVGEATVTAEYENAQDTVDITVEEDIKENCADVSFEQDGGAYLVTTGPELQCISDTDPGGEFEIRDDIDARLPSEFTPPDGGDGFAPIESFEGELSNPEGHRIMQLTISRPNSNNVGLFGTLEDDSEITELYIEDADIEGDVSVGGVVGEADDAFINEVKVSGQVSGASQVGGIVGFSNSENFEIEEVFSRAEVTGTEDVGGVAGGITEDSISLSDLVAVETVTGDVDAGGLIGFTDARGCCDVSIDGGYWDTTASGTTQNDAVGGGAGAVGSFEGLVTEEMQGDEAMDNMDDLDFDGTWVTRDSDYPIFTIMEAAPQFFVEITGSTEVVEGDSYSTTIYVENTGDEQGVQNVELDVDGLGTDSSIISLEPGDSVTESFVIDTENGDAGDYTAVASSENTDDTATVTVDYETFFNVTLVNTNSPIESGETLEGEVEIDNQGVEEDTQNVVFDSPDIGSDEQSVTVDGESSTTETFSLNTDDQSGGYTVTASSDDTDDSESITIESDAESDFVVDIVDVNEPVEEELLTVTIDIENQGGEVDEQSISVESDGLGSTSTTVNLESEESKTVEVDLETSEGDAGDYTINTSSLDDSDSTQATVIPLHYFAVTIDSVTEPVENAPVEVTVDIENQGAEETQQDITLDIDGLGSDETSVSVGSEVTETVTLTVDTDSGDGGSYTATVSSEDETDDITVNVDQPPLIDNLRASDGGHPQQPEADIEFLAEQGSYSIESWELVAIDDNTGNEDVIDSENGLNAEEVSREYEDERLNDNGDYTIELTVWDSEGNVVVDEDNVSV